MYIYAALVKSALGTRSFYSIYTLYNALVYTHSGVGRVPGEASQQFCLRAWFMQSILL